MAKRYHLILMTLLGGAFVACEVSVEDEQAAQHSKQEVGEYDKAPKVPEAPWDSAASGDRDRVGELLTAAEEAINFVRTIRGDVPSPELMEVGQLERLLPREVEGLLRTSTGEQTNQINRLLSAASATYADANRSVMVFIADLAPLSGLARLAFMDWQEGGIDRESNRGFERTRPFQVRKKTWPSYEKFEVEDGHASCTIQVWVAGRFFVGVEGDGVGMGVCEETRDDISFSKLERYAANNLLQP